jgi:hypothetical protein
VKVIAFMLATAGCFAADGAAAVQQEPTTSGCGVYVGYIQTAKQAAVSVVRDSPVVSDTYLFFSGQNIQNAREEDYVRGFIQGTYTIEVLYGLYLALKEFFVCETGQFAPEDLNGGFTGYNYNFLKAVFEEPASTE